jgi:hypothetical protein
MEASEGGKIPIVCDTSPCLSQIKVGPQKQRGSANRVGPCQGSGLAQAFIGPAARRQRRVGAPHPPTTPLACRRRPRPQAGISEPALRFALYEPVEFIRHFLVDKLEFSKVC